MAKRKLFLIALFSVLMLICISFKFININNVRSEKSSTKIPNCQSDNVTTTIYNITGVLIYKLNAPHVQYFNNMQLALFTKPIVIIFDIEEQIPSWLVSADFAKLIYSNNRMLYLYGNVQINNLDNISSYFKSIKMNNATINLLTQDILSDDVVELYSNQFNSIGNKMRGNLQNKTAELIENVETLYKFHNS